MSTESQRPESEVDEPKASGVLTSVDGVELAPYAEWRGHATDPRTASLEEAAEILQAIIDAEGPVMENRAYQTYVRASGIQRLGPQVRRVLNRALARLVRRKRVVVERSAVLRTPETDWVKLREIGPRSFDEVPLSELASLVRAVRSSRPDAKSDEIYRDVLEIYGLVRMTAQVRKQFEEAENL